MCVCILFFFFFLDRFTWWKTQDRMVGKCLSYWVGNPVSGRYWILLKTLGWRTRSLSCYTISEYAFSLPLFYCMSTFIFIWYSTNLGIMRYPTVFNNFLRFLMILPYIFQRQGVWYGKLRTFMLFLEIPNFFVIK